MTILRTVFMKAPKILIIPIDFALTLFLLAAGAKPSPKRGEGLESASPSPLLGEGAGGCRRKTSRRVGELVQNCPNHCYEVAKR